MKKFAGDIIILHICTKNHNHIMYGSWDMEPDRQNFLSFWTIFCTFIPLTTWKIKISNKWKNHQDLLLLYTCVPYMKIIWCTVPEIWSMWWTEFFVILDRFCQKMKQTPGDIIILHMCTVNDNHMSAQWMDGWTDGWKKWHIEVGAPLIIEKPIFCSNIYRLRQKSANNSDNMDGKYKITISLDRIH